MRKALLVLIALGALFIFIPSQTDAHNKKSSNRHNRQTYHHGSYSHSYSYSYPSYSCSYSYPSYSYGSYYNNHCYTYREAWRYVPGYYFNYCGRQYYQPGYWQHYYY